MALQQQIQSVALVLILAVAACSSPTTPAGQGADTAAPATDAADTAVASDATTADGDAATAADAGADGTAQDGAPAADSLADATVSDVAVSDTSPGQDADSSVDVSYDAGCGPCTLNCVCKKDYNGCPLQECESATCVDLMGQITALEPKLTACTKDKGCQPFEFPICGSVGCFQLGVGVGNDLSALENLAGKAGAASCSGFHCGCGPAPPTFCLGGKCRTCPPDCDGTCDEKLAALVGTAQQLASFCGSDSECTVVATGMCPVGGLPCGGIAVNKYAKTDALLGLVAAYTGPCGAAMCKCAVPGPAVCLKGKCTVAP
ncbi:MAG: hypothetical protein HY902_12700 [Deltaproteobacteria bacterium]|nr:hypothetical protein [Deltaproteobacteria bacterium]